VGKLALGQVFSKLIGFPYHYHSTLTLHARISPGG
jgi:hypothetical protein